MDLDLDFLELLDLELLDLDFLDLDLLDLDFLDLFPPKDEDTLEIDIDWAGGTTGAEVTSGAEVTGAEVTDILAFDGRILPFVLEV